MSWNAVYAPSALSELYAVYAAELASSGFVNSCRMLLRNKYR